MARVKIQITTPSNNVIKVSPGVSALSSVQLYLNELIDVNTQHGADGYVLTQQADGTFAMEAVATTLAELSDTNILNPQGGDSLVYDANSQKWVPGGVKSVNGQEGDVVITIPSPPPTPGVSGLADTNITNLQDDQIIRYDSASGKWLNEDLEALPSGGTTGQALVKASNTDYDVTWDDIAVDVQFHQRYATEAETLRSGATETVELYFFAQGDGNGLAESASSDTPTSGYDIRRKLWYAEKAQADPDTSADWTQFTAIADNTTFANAKAALLAYLKERTGGTVPISLKMTWEEVAQAPAFTGLLNESYGSGAEAAYSTRRLNGNYSGDCMTIRRASDGTTQSIGFVGEEIDESAIETFCTGTTCTVATWFDQSGNGNHATQPTPANQPTIYTGGQLVKEGGRLTLDFDSTDRFELSTLSITSGTALSYFWIMNPTGGTSYRWILHSQETDYFVPIADDGATNTKYDGFTNGSFFADGQSVTINNRNDVYDTYSNAFRLGALIGETTVNVTSSRIGTRSTGSFGIDGILSEFILYDSNKSSVRTDIEGNISAYFQSAKLLDEQYGSGAEAAYSTRQLRRDQTECMVIRRASDSTTQTIGFDGSGNIDESAIETFCTGTTCTVVTWKDQSGNGNDATAAASGNEPTIYTGGALVKEDGRVAIEFDGSNDHLDAGAGFDLSTLTISTVQKAIDNGINVDAYVPIALQDANNNTGVRQQIKRSSPTALRSRFNNTNIDLEVNTLYKKLLFTTLYNGTNGFSYFDGSNEQTALASLSSTSSLPLTIGQTNASVSVYKGKLQEALLFNSSKSTSDRTSIESNIGDYFTQNTPLLDTYSGAAAAYSLRLLDSTYTGSAVEVYNGSSYADIGFNVFGELDTVALAAHCGSNDGFVSVWYDQSGNSNDATQATTASMPKIYDGSTGVVTENGKPSLEISNRQITASLTTTDDLHLFAVNNKTASSSRADFLSDGSGNPHIRYENDNTKIYLTNPFTLASSAQNPNTQQLLEALWNQSASYIAIDTVKGSNVTQNNMSLSSITIGDSISQSFAGFVQEVIFYTTEQSERLGISSNINTFYSIY
jgi:hypothetical protein